MPNAFNPTASGRPAASGPVTTGNANIKSFRIYPRWGELVHDANTTWDGTFKGAKQPVGTYVYYISVEIPDPQNPGTNKTLKQQGSFVLLR